MSPAYQRLMGVMRRYISSLNAETLVQKALREQGLTPDLMTILDIAKLMPNLERGMRLFVAVAKQSDVRSELLRLADVSNLESSEIQIREEADISAARLAARSLCRDLGARNATVQAIATVVSELARNIASYTPGGSITMRVMDGTLRRFVLEAIDTGKGISNLDQILAGNYQSKTGLGKGIMGVKRLANQFSIETNGSGTRIHVEFFL